MNRRPDGYGGAARIRQARRRALPARRMLSRHGRRLIWACGLVVALCLLGAIGFGTWVRLKPLPVSEYHVMTATVPTGDYPRPGSFMAVREAGPVEFSQLDGLIQATPRTRVLAGSVADGHVSYVSRSRFWHFPVVTNLWLADGHLHLNGRQVFNEGDFGLNVERIAGWLRAAGLPSPSVSP